MSLHVTDFGVPFQVTCKEGSEVLDVSEATTREISFQKPNNGAIIGPFEMVLGSDGTDGVVIHVWDVGQLDTAGEWSYQLHLVFADKEVHSDWHDRNGKFTVYGNMS